MILTSYDPERNFDTLRGWITGEREHALWCAGRFACPLDRENFAAALRELAEKKGDRPLLALAEDGTPAGFLCCSVSPETRTGRLKFVAVDPARRGEGLGRSMVRLAVREAFASGAEEVRLAVFEQNPRALRCYLSAGFRVLGADPGAFRFGDEVWTRVHMGIRREDFPG